MQEKAKLVELGKELYRLKIEAETARTRLRKLVEAGTPHDSEEMASAALQLQFLQAQWSEKEAAYLQLRDRLSPAKDKKIFLC